MDSMMTNEMFAWTVATNQISCSLIISFRARVKKSFFDSPGSNHMGGPTVMQLISGTGRNSPFGMIRFILFK